MACLFSLPFYFSGHEDFACSVVCAGTYIHAWLALLQQRQFILGTYFTTLSIFISLKLVIVSLFVIPTLNLFTRRRQVFWALITFAANVALTALYLLVLFPSGKREFVTPTYVIKSSILISSISNGVSICITIFIGSLVNKVYDDVKHTNESIEANTREKEDFFATISHEIRNPLQSLQGSVELLSELNKASNSTQLKADLPPLLEICKGCCGIVINMVSNILDMSKIAADKMQLSPTPTDLAEVVNRILRSSRTRAEGKFVGLEFERDPAFPPAVDVDPQRVEQILVNLVSNAIKFTGAKGRVVVKLSWTPFAAGEPELDIEAVLAKSSWKSVMELAESGFSPAKKAQCPRGLLSKYRQTAAPSEMNPRARIKSVNMCKPQPQLHEDSPCCFSDALDRNGDLCYSLRKKASRGMVKVEVMDSGIGISKEGIAKLFHPYQQANATISR